MEDEKAKLKQKQTELTKLTKKWENESKKYKTEIEYLEQTNKNLNESLKSNETTISKLVSYFLSSFIENIFGIARTSFF